MKRLLLAFALLCLAVPAHATGTGRLLVVYDENPNICVDGCTPDDAVLVDSLRQAARGMIRRGYANLQYQLQRYGVDYDAFSPYEIKTEEARIGKVTVGRGTSGAVTKEYSATLFFPFDGNDPVTAKTCRADSLFRYPRHITSTAVTNGPSVPAAFVFRPNNPGAAGYQLGLFNRSHPMFVSQAASSATRCSLGVFSYWGAQDGSEDTPPGALPVQARNPTQKRIWFPSANLPSVHLAHGISSVFNVVPLVQSFYQTPNNAAGEGGRGGVQKLRPDSVSAGGIYDGLDFIPLSQEALDSDTLGYVAVWERRFEKNAAAASQGNNSNGTSVFGYPVNVVGYYWGAAPCSDTASGQRGNGTSPFVPCEGASENLLFMLARLDSLSGGALFDRSKAPIVAAPVVYGGFSRASRRHYYGVAPSDTSSLWATMDSLKAEGIPITVAANVDSIQAYASEIAQWKKVGKVKFVPWSRSGQAATQAGTVASPTAFRDIWGRVRSRMLYGNAGTWGAANDTSLRALLRYATDTLGTQVGREYVIRNAAVALDDDWSPTNAASISNFTDSLAFTLNSLGISRLVIDAQVTDAHKVAAASRIGWGPRKQGTLKTSNPPASLMLLGHTGYSISGGAIQDDYGNDSTTYAFSTCCNGFSTAPMSAKNVNRWMTGLLGPENYKDYDYFPSDGRASSGWKKYGSDEDAYHYYNVNVSVRDYMYPFQRACVLRLGPNDLAGSTTAPVRPAYFSLKSLNNLFNALNKTAYGNMPLIRLGTLDEANP